MKSAIVPFCSSHDIRYVITSDNLAYVTLLATGRRFVVQARYFRKVADIHPRAVLGSIALNDAQLRELGVLPAKIERKEAATDARTLVYA